MFLHGMCTEAKGIEYPLSYELPEGFARNEIS